ncbi:MAG: DUF3500 domain-containing protein [Pseudomonadota bacterium]
MQIKGEAAPSRRGVLAAGAALAVGAVLPGTARAQGDTGAQMRARAETFLMGLDEAGQAAALFAFDDPLRRRWNYMTGSRVSPGLPLEAMSAEQRMAAMDLLATGLSAGGMAKAEAVMVLQDVLRDELNKGAPDRNSLRFSMAVFGVPSVDGPWTWRFEGHHLTLSYTLVGEELVSVTPSSFSSDPNEVRSGPHDGLVALAEEETLGRQLFGDLTGGARRAALLQETSPGNVLALPGQEGQFRGDRLGLALGDMSSGQADLARRMLTVYAVDHLPEPLAEEQRARVFGGDAAAIRFGWAGDPGRGSVYYRLSGESFVIEFATLRNQPLHHHTIRHDFDRNMGAHRLG